MTKEDFELLLDALRACITDAHAVAYRDAGPLAARRLQAINEIVYAAIDAALDDLDGGAE